MHPSSAAFETPIVFQQCAGLDDGDVASTAVSFNADVQAGDLVIVMLDWGNDSATPIALTDTLGTSYVIFAGPTDSSSSANYLAYGFAPASGPDTTRVTLSDVGGTHNELRVCEFSGISPSDPLDATASTSGTASGASTLITSPPFTTTSPHELAFSFENGNVFASAGDGWTEATGLDSDESEYAIEELPGTYQSTTPATGGGGYSVMIATFRGN